MDAKTAAALDRAARQTVDTLWLRKEQDRINRERREQAKKIKEDGREDDPVCERCGKPLNLEAGDFQPDEHGGDVCDACCEAEAASR